PQTLAGLASPVKVSALVRQNFSALANAAQPTSSSTSNRWAEILNPNLSAQVASAGGVSALNTKPAGLSPAAKAIIVKHIPLPDYWPSQLNFGSLYSGQSQTKTISVIAPVDSVVM